MRSEVMNDESKYPPKVEENSDISLWLDSYDDIFSDFDPRPFSERNISDDFLYEIKKVSTEHHLSINELKLLLPEKIRVHETETVIVKRLRSFFTKNYHHFLKKKKAERKKDLLFILTGALLMLCAGMVSSLKSGSLLMHALLVIVEPAGWFLVWTGMDNLINIARREKPELDFYIKLSKSKIIFLNV